MESVVLLNLYGANGALRRIDIGLVVHVRVVLLFQTHEDGGQLVHRLLRQFFAQSLVFRNGGQVVVPHDGFDI